MRTEERSLSRKGRLRLPQQACEAIGNQSREHQSGKGRRAGRAGGNHRTTLALHPSPPDLSITATWMACHRVDGRAPRPEPLTPESRMRPEHAFLTVPANAHAALGARGAAALDQPPGEQDLPDRRQP